MIVTSVLQELVLIAGVGVLAAVALVWLKLPTITGLLLAGAIVGPYGLRVDHVDEHGHVTSTLREWKRRDWGEGGAEFHWWCTEAPDAFVGDRPVYVELRDEIIEMTSAVAYELLTKELKARRRKTLLPHPAVRR